MRRMKKHNLYTLEDSLFKIHGRNLKYYGLFILYVLAIKYSVSVMIRMEKAMAPHSSTLAWKIPWMEGPGGLQSMGSLRVRHDWVTSLSLFTFMHWRRKWQPTPVFLPRESQGRGSLVGCHLWGRIELDTTEATAAGAAAVYFRYQSFINFFFFTKIFSKSMACLFILLRGLSCPTPHKLRVCLG